ncbi:UPF0728 protein C10orf53 homolog [Patagioenas fasciata]|uniref:UPF0728 protein C10orf53 homolog n=1 Tax=Patagioenas fasciata TaxID=372321 RepID=UPI0032E88331
MPRAALVTVRHVPARSRGLPRNGASRLQGLRAVLQADGHQLVMEEIPDWNSVELVVNGETVFRCNINDLDFGGDGKLDPLCEEARKAVLNAY